MANWRKVPAVKPDTYPNPKVTMQYKKPIGPEQPEKVSTKEKLKSGLKKTVEYVAPKVKSAGMRVAQNAQRSSGTRDSGMINLQPPKDTFSFQAPSFMMGMPGQQQEQAAPRKKRRKAPKQQAKRRAAPRGNGGQSWQQLGGVPDSVKKWMM